MKFLDRARIYLKSGKGGSGCLSFRREKYVQFGGPDGGDGGRGGHIFAQAVENLNTLIDFRYQQHYKAAVGIHGMGRDMTGGAGDDLYIKVPVGTQIFEEDEETLIADLDRPGEIVLLAKGGNGGFGNSRFQTSTNQAPRKANPGQEAEERTIWLRLKLIADIGLLGLPNAGKSTFLAAVSAAKPKIADYPFTTLHPNLGVVRISSGTSFVIADIPGIIEGAHEGAGIGDRFLGHVERCAALLHLVDGTEDDVAANYTTIRNELAAYSEELAGRDEFLALNKCDSLTQEEIIDKKAALEKVSGKKVYVISGVAKTNIDPLLGDLMTAVASRKEQELKASLPATKGWTPDVS